MTGATRISALGCTGAAIVWLIVASGYRDSTLIADSARDVVAAAQLLDSGLFPSTGPSLYGTWVLGPLWFWLFAALVWMLPSLPFVYVALGLLAMSKLLLAWRIGRRLVGPEFAAVFATLLFWPGWSFIESVVVTHTNLIQATALLFVLAALRARDSPNAFRIVLMAGAFAVALSTHPTNVLYAPLLALPLFAGTRARLAAVPPLIIGGLIVLLSLLPGLLHEAASAGAASQGFFARLPEPGALQRWPGVIYALLLDAQGSFLQQVGLSWPALANILRGIYPALAVLGAAGWLLAPRGQRVWLWFALIVLVAWSGVLAAMRPTTPTWMLLSAQPLAVAVTAYGITLLLQRLSARARFTAFASIVGVSLLAAMTYAAARQDRARAGFEWHASARISDVTQPAIVQAVNGPHLPPRAQAAVAALGCRTSPRLALFGDLAVLAEATQGATLRLAGCHPSRWPALGPKAGQLHVAGLPRGIARQLGLRGATWSSFVWIPVARVLAPARGSTLHYNAKYPPYAQAAFVANPVAVDNRLAGNEVLVVTSLLLGFLPPRAVLSVDGTVLVPIADSGSSIYFRCPDATACRVRGTVAGGAREWLQVFVLKTGGSA